MKRWPCRSCLSPWIPKHSPWIKNQSYFFYYTYYVWLRLKYFGSCLFCVFYYTSTCCFVGLLLGRQGWGKVGMNKKINLMGRITSELKTGNLFPVFSVKSCSPGQWPGALGLKVCSFYITAHSPYKEVLVKSANLSVPVTVSSKHLTKKTETRLQVWEGTGQTSWAVLLLLSITFSSGLRILILFSTY